MDPADERALANARRRFGARRPSGRILILCDGPDALQARVDALIRAGNLVDADRPRCVFCDDATFAALTHDERVLAWAVNETADDRRGRDVESAARAQAALAEIVAAAAKPKSETAGSL